MKKKKRKESPIGSWEIMKDCCRRDSEFEGFFARSFMFTVAAVILPFEAVKVGIEALGGEFKEGDNGPYDL